MAVSVVTATMSLGSSAVKCGGSLPLSARPISQDHDSSKDVLRPQPCDVPVHGTPHAGQANEGRLTLAEQNTHLYSGVRIPKDPPAPHTTHTQHTRLLRHQQEPAVRPLRKQTVLALLGPPSASHQGQALPDRQACSSCVALGK